MRRRLASASAENDPLHVRVCAVCAFAQLGSYFGSSVCAIDLNADGLSDLLVGAPMATGVTREEGRVHVYINQGQVGPTHTHAHIFTNNQEYF